MTDRLKGLTVTLKPDIREDDAEPLIQAIKLLSGVVDVVEHVEDMNHHLAVTTAKRELQQKLRDILWD